MMTLKELGIADAGSAQELLDLLRSDAYSRELAKSKFGFRAYNRLSQLRSIAITKPSAYLAAKSTRVMGGVAPNVNDAATGNLSRGEIKTLYGVEPGANIIGVAGEVGDVYARTLSQLYTAGANESDSDRYATAVAQALLQSSMAVIESEFPDVVDNASERNLLLNQLGTLGGRIAMGTPKVASTALVRK